MDAESKKINNESKDESNDSEDVSKTKNGSHSLREDEPKAKISKLNHLEKIVIDLTLNRTYFTKEFANLLKGRWSGQQKEDFKDPATGATVYRDPFQICLLPELLHNKQSCQQLVNEMIQKVHWSRKQMDLYEFYQSTDLSNMAECKILTNVLQTLRRNVRPWLEKVTNLKLDYVSASCSMYTCGDYLLVHDDLLKDRQIAFVYYLSPWDNSEEWTEAQGGCLEIFNSDERCFPQFPVRRKISPKNNQFVFFKVGSRSFHQVGEVTNFDYPRLTINGWFHGASNNDIVSDSLREITAFDFKGPQDTTLEMESLVNEVYLKPTTRISIQKRIEDNSEICLYEFLQREIFEQALLELLVDNSLIWRCQGPANAFNYEVLEIDSASKTIAKIISLFSSWKMFDLLRDYTDLDLSGANAVSPKFSLEIQRWSHGNYTVLGDGGICEENTLDLIYYLNATEGVGVITYLSPESEPIPRPSSSRNNQNESIDDEDDDSVLLTIAPVDNSLNIVYRCEGTTKFTKYVSRNTPLEKGPVFVIFCSYKE